MSKLYTCLDNNYNSMRNHNIGDGKLHIFEVYEEDGSIMPKEILYVGILH